MTIEEAKKHKLYIHNEEVYDVIEVVDTPYVKVKNLHTNTEYKIYFDDRKLTEFKPLVKKCCSAGTEMKLDVDDM